MSMNQKRSDASKKIISSRYNSFSVLAMAIILSIGTIFIILDYTVEYIFTWMDKRWLTHNDSRTYARLEWATNSTLQLQRLAHEELGLGTWHSCAGQNPVTEAHEKLGSLDVSNGRHPVLRRPYAGTAAELEPEVVAEINSEVDAEVDSGRDSETYVEVDAEQNDEIDVKISANVDAGTDAGTEESRRSEIY
jgi:hypothetical protein